MGIGSRKLLLALEHLERLQGVQAALGERFGLKAEEVGRGGVHVGKMAVLLLVLHH